MKRFGVFLLAFVLILTACNGGQTESSNSGEANGEKIRIAVAGPLTGDNAEYGIGFHNAVQLAAKEWNDKGGIHGRLIEVVDFDDKNSPEEGVSVANKIVSEGFDCVIGHFASGVSMAAAPIYQDNGTIEISPSASHPDYSGIGDFIFRNNTIINVEAESSLDIAVNDFDCKKIGIISIKTDWGVSTSEVVKQLVDGMDGVEIVAHEEVIEGSDDYRPALTKINESGAEAVIAIGMYNLVAPVARQLSEINSKIRIVGFSNAYSRELLKLGGDAVEGVGFPVIFFADSEDENVKDFVKEYVDAYGSEPSALTAQAYDSAHIYFEALSGLEEGASNEQVRDEIYKLSYSGVTGNTKFDENGDVKKPFTKVVIRDGAFVKLGDA